MLLLTPGRPCHAAVAARGRFAELLPLGELDGGSPRDVRNEEVEEQVVAVVGGVDALGEQVAGVVGVHVVVVPAKKRQQVLE